MTFPSLSKNLGRKATHRQLKLWGDSKIDYFPVETFDHLIHYISLIPFSTGSTSVNDIWSSPEFLMQMGKGEVEEHVLLLTNLFMGIKEESDESTEDIPTTTTKSRKKQ
mmetsp:Transcript_6840/g.864  ORF Transcript_6840/g.864 Transcript_6840/m.864 type:complete len:109 (-) Transcript_6840:1254-1580(-)